MVQMDLKDVLPAKRGALFLRLYANGTSARRTAFTDVHLWMAEEPKNVKHAYERQGENGGGLEERRGS
jgi:hypothetical protein